ncbi:TIGR03089 family protein [Cellulomonas citrea]|uniref:TIGR03089 family protein n=1 Tax=Cellulomonas citrea TaxID=1909423 RepID=UPI00135BEC75|nr:TIGR03089 family protein [Cellulomonas citrea]
MQENPGAQVLATVLTDPGRPRITWYGADGERVELSGAVLANWVAKTANLLVEEFDAGPGTRVLVALPVHWRSAVWALAVWRVGACVVVPMTTDDDGAGTTGQGREARPVDLVVTDRPAAHPGAQEVVAVTLAALARRFDGVLPAGAIDAAAAVMTYSDRLGWVPETEPEQPALLAGGQATSHSALAGAARTTTASGARVLLTGAGLETTLTQVLAVLTTAGSVVLLDDTTATGLRSDAARRAALVAAERVTVDLL